MRGLLALGLFVMLCASADAATVHHARTRPHVITHPRQDGIVRQFAPEQSTFPGWGLGYKPIPPEENRNLDPSNFGGG